MTTTRAKGYRRDAALLAVVITLTVAALQFEQYVAEFVSRHITATMLVIVGSCIFAMGWCLVHVGSRDSAAPAQLAPRSWNATPQVEVRCDLCGDANVTFVCGDHNLTLCTACTHRHDRLSRCNIRYVPAVHEFHGRRA